MTTFPGIGWTEPRLDKQTLSLLVRLSSMQMHYETCSNLAKTCNLFTQNAADRRSVIGSCDNLESKQHCNEGVSPCLVDNICAATNYPAELPCPSNTETLLDQFHGTNYAFTSSFVDSVPFGWWVHVCVANCNRKRICRGPLDFPNSIDLGTAHAWSLKPPTDAELNLVTFATTVDDMFHASVNARFDFDLTATMDTLNVDCLVHWALDLCTKDNASVMANNLGTIGPGSLATWPATKAIAVKLAAMASVLCVVNYCYDALFTEFTTNTFKAVNTMSTNAVQNFLTSSSHLTFDRFGGIDEYGQEDYLALRTLAASFPTAPKASQDTADKSSCVVTLYLSRKQLLPLLDANINNPYASQYMANFLRDKNGKFRRPRTDPISGQDPILRFANFTDVRAVTLSLVPSAYKRGPELSIDIHGDIVVPAGVDITDLIVVQYAVKTTVLRWSIMLAAYFQMDTPANFTETTCDKFISDGVPLRVRACFDAATGEQQEEYRAKSCGVEYVPPEGVAGLENWMLYLDAKDPLTGGATCRCYNANLGLSTDMDSVDARITSKCFSAQCGLVDRIQDGLTDDVCSAKDHCARMQRWVASTNPAQRGEDLDNFDWVRFALLCGKTIQPLGDVHFDWKMSLAMTVTLVLLAVGTAVLLRRAPGKKMRTPAVYWTVVGVLLAIGLILGVASGFVLAGKSTCQDNGTWPRKPVCRSWLLGTPLLQELCPYVAQCECQVDKDCGGNCGCAAGFCTSVTGQRPTTTKSETTVDLYVMLPLLALAIAAPIAVVEGVKARPAKPPMDSRVLAGISAAVAVVLVIAAVAGGIRVRKNVLVFDDAPACTADLPPMLTVYDVVKNVYVSFPTQSIWTTTGFPGDESSRHGPFACSAESPLMEEAVREVLKVYPEGCDLTTSKRALAFVDNSANNPQKTDYYVFEMPVSERGNTVAVSRIRDIGSLDVDKWSVAWGKVSIHTDIITALPTIYTVTSTTETGVETTTAGNLYTLRKKDESKDDPRMLTGPMRITPKSEPLFFLTAKEKILLHHTWDGVTYQTAMMTYTEGEDAPWRYFLQVNADLVCMASTQSGFTKLVVGKGSVDLMTVDCREMP